MNQFRWTIEWLIAAILITAGMVYGDTPSLIILYTTSTLGEVNETGCGAYVAGGLARRVAVIEQVRRESSKVIVVDSGNLFFPLPTIPDFLEFEYKSNATLIADVLRQIQVDVVGIGRTDLADKAFLRTTRLPMVSIDGGAFESFRIIERGGKKVAFLSVYEDPKNSEAHLKTLQGYVEKLRKKVDWIVVLTHGEVAFNHRIATAIPSVDFIITDNPSKSVGAVDKVGTTYILYGGSRGTYLGKLMIFENDASPEAPLTDFTYTYQIRSELEWQRTELGAYLKRAKLSDDGDPFKKLFKAFKKDDAAIRDLESIQRYMTYYQTELKKSPPIAGNGFIHKTIRLADTVQGDPKIQKLVDDMTKKFDNIDAVK